MKEQAFAAILAGKVLGQDGPVGGQSAQGIQLVAHAARGVGPAVGRERERHERVFQPVGAQGVFQFAPVAAKEQAGFVGAAHTVPAPEGWLRAARVAGAHEHPVAQDVHNLPAERAQQKAVAQPGLKDELFIQLAQARAVLQVHAKPAPVGNCAAGHQRQHAAVRRAGHDAVHAVVVQARGGGRVRFALKIARQHAEHILQLLARKLAVAVRLPREAQGVLHAVARFHGHGNQMLRQHVQAQAGRAHGFDGFLDCAACDEGRRQDFAHFARIQAHHAHLVRPVPGAAQALQRARDGAGRADLHHEIDFAHVDAQLHGGGGAQHAQLARFELPFGFQPLLAGNAAVVRAREALAAQLVEAVRHLFAGGAALAEHERGARTAGGFVYMAEDLRPNAAFGQGAEILHGGLHPDVRRLADLRRDHGHGPGRAILPTGQACRGHG